MYAPLFTISPELLRLISIASELKAWMNQNVVDVMWLPKLQKETAARLAHSSTAIEGNPLTLPEVEALARGEEIGVAEKAAREVNNYLAAMRWIWDKKANEQIREADLLHLHRLLTFETMNKESVACYKSRQNRVINSRGITIYTPPGPAQARPLTRNLLAWLNCKASVQLHPIISSAIAHHRLVSIHPFMDGNGRMARALAVWILYTRGFDTHHLFALDEYYEQDRQRYYDKIQQARDLDDDLTYWLEYVADGVVVTLNRTKERILSLQVTAKSPKMMLTKRQEDFLRYLRDKGRVRSADIEKAFKITRARVAQVIKPLVDAGLVVREGQTRATTYRLA